MNKQRGALISIFSNTALVGFKITAGVFIGSVSVISEGVHSAIDLIASFVAYFSIRKSMEPADKDHPYGHGKFENISGFFEATLIFMAAGLIIWEAVQRIARPAAEMPKLDWGIAVMLVSVIVNTFVSISLFRIAKREKSIALEADAMHLSVDVFTSLGVFAGLIVIRFTGLTILDPIIALVVAAMILKASWDLTRKTLGDLADKALPDEEVSHIKRIIENYPQVKAFHRLRCRKSGNQREIDIHVKMASNTHIDKAHTLCHRIEDDIKAALPGSYIVMHVEPFSDTGTRLPAQ